MLALVMCAHSPESIGAKVWEQHPTLRALIKMVTSNRFRFPTVDCDENERTEMKQSEQVARDEVCSRVVTIFPSCGYFDLKPPLLDKNRKLG